MTNNLPHDKELCFDDIEENITLEAIEKIDGFIACSHSEYDVSMLKDHCIEILFEELYEGEYLPVQEGDYRYEEIAEQVEIIEKGGFLVGLQNTGR